MEYTDFPAPVMDGIENRWREILKTPVEQALQTDPTAVLRAALFYMFDGGRHAEVFDAMAAAERETL